MSPDRPLIYRSEEFYELYHTAVSESGDAGEVDEGQSIIFERVNDDDPPTR